MFHLTSETDQKIKNRKNSISKCEFTLNLSFKISLKSNNKSLLNIFTERKNTYFSQI